jgi:hypothetical protein
MEYSQGGDDVAQVAAASSSGAALQDARPEVELQQPPGPQDGPNALLQGSQGRQETAAGSRLRLRLCMSRKRSVVSILPVAM